MPQETMFAILHGTVIFGEKFDQRNQDINSDDEFLANGLDSCNLL